MGIPMGGVKTTTLVRCTRCERGAAIPPGMIMRIPADKPNGHCHEIVNPNTGAVINRG